MRRAGRGSNVHAVLRHHLVPDSITMICRAFSRLAIGLAMAIGCGPPAELPSNVRTVSTPCLWGDLRPGAWNVGVRIDRLADTTRPERLSDGTLGARPLEMVVWYPAPRAGLTRDAVRFATYVDLSMGAMTASEGGVDADARRRWLAQSISGDSSAVTPSIIDGLLRSPMAAVRDLPPASTRQPAILWSTRHATPAAQSVLSEYLASHGYVVAWMRYAGSDSLRPPFDDVSRRRKAETLEAHVADMQTALRRLAGRPDVDSTRLGVAAWSYSGEPATVLVQRTPSLRVLVSLSSNVFVSTYRDVDIRASFDSLPLRVGVLMLEETGAARGRARDALPVLDALPGKAIRVSFPALAHGNFNVLEGMIPGLLRISNVQPWSIGGRVAQSGYEAVAQAVLGLLEKTMRGAAHYGGFHPADGVQVVLHGPGRGVSATDGTRFRDTTIAIVSGDWKLAANFTHPEGRAARVPAVLMLNKANGNRQVYAWLARELARRGIASLRLDLRGEGESATIASFVPYVRNVALERAEDDVVAAMRWLRGQAAVDSARIGVVGASYSGEVMALAQRASATASAYVALSPGSLSTQTIDEIDDRRVPWWILRSRDERFVRDVMEAARTRSRTARVTEVPGRAHATDMLISNPNLNARIADWLAQVLGR
jgi:dienelactone hydrolase